MGANETGSLVFFDDVTADRSMTSDVCMAILSAQIQPNATKLLGLCFKEQMDNDPKHMAKAIQEILKAKKLSILQWPYPFPYLYPVEHAFLLT